MIRGQRGSLRADKVGKPVQADDPLRDGRQG